MGSKERMSWTDWRGNRITREVNQVIDVRDFVGTPGYALLVVAANTNLSKADVLRYLKALEDKGMEGVRRSLGWVQRRRWLFQLPDANNWKGPRKNADGKDERAHTIMAANPTLSLRDLVLLLKDQGIARSREWVRQNRCLTGKVAT